MSIFAEEQTEACFRMAIALPVSPIQIGALVVLFIAFLCIPGIAKAIGPTIDTLPMRFAAVILVLAILPHDKLIALGLFLVVAGLYIQRHHNDVQSVLEKTADSNGRLRFPVDAIQDPAAMRVLHHGGHADESYDTMDFMPKQSSQDNEFDASHSHSIDTKHILPTEPLGSKSQNLFGEDMRHAENMQRGNSDGAA